MAEQKYPPIPFSNNPLPEWDAFKLHIGIDFGTDGSGLAYALHDGTVYIHNLWKECDPTQKPKTSVLFDDRGRVQSIGSEALRTYTTSRNNQGWKLFECFKMHLYDDPLWRSQIQNKEEKIDKVDLKQQIHATNDKKLSESSETVFVQELKYLKEQSEEFIDKNFAKKSQMSLNHDQIQYILTVPAIWSDSAKDQMKHWAIKAGLIEGHIPNQLKIVYEPDCASLSIQHAIVRNIQNNNSKKKRKKRRKSKNKQLKSHRPMIDIDVTFGKGDKYILIDTGGGTCDVAAHEVIDEFAIAEVIHPSGGCWGSTEIDKEFEKVLENVFGEKWMNEFREKFAAMYLQLMDNFISFSKSTFLYIKRDYHSITMPKQFSTFLLEKFEDDTDTKGMNVNPTDDNCDNEGDEDNLSDEDNQKPYYTYINPKNEGDDEKSEESDDTTESSGDETTQNVLLNNYLQERCTKLYKHKNWIKITEMKYGYSRAYSLLLHNDLWIKLFNVIIDPIINHCTKILQNDGMKGCKYIFLVGGFANSTYFQQTMKNRFNSNKISVIIPQLPQLCVVDGAARYGLQPSFVKIRRLAKTYGIRCYKGVSSINEKLFPSDFIKKNKYFDEEEKEYYVAECFKIFAVRNKPIHRNDKPIIHEFSKKIKDAKEIKIIIYETRKKDPLTVTKRDEVQELGEFSLDVSNTDEQKIIVEFSYSDTLLTVYAYPNGREDLKKEEKVTYKSYE